MKKIIIILSVLFLCSCCSYNCCLAQPQQLNVQIEDISIDLLKESNIERIEIIENDLYWCYYNNNCINYTDYNDLMSKLDYLRSINDNNPVKCAKGILLIDEEYANKLNNLQ
jgi:hypothetical protein